MKREIELDVAGQRLRVRTDEDEVYMRSLAGYVDEQMREIGRGQRGITSMNVAVLAALRIADEFHKLKRLQEQIDAALDRLADEVAVTVEKIPR
ncbi:MAG TPA: cell division protein ZapA [Candidatus Binatia bacterium]|nr:cell division protein ZapA [Candidatus Binatia bacterium]